MSALHAIYKMCRFCLNKNEEQLFAATEILDDCLTNEIVQIFTGVQLNSSNNIPYAVCGSCRDVLRAWLEFRNSCLSNDLLFKQSFSINTESFGDKMDENGLEPQRRDTNLLQVEIVLTNEKRINHNDLSESSIDTLETEWELIEGEPFVQWRQERGIEHVTCSTTTDEMEVKTNFELPTNGELDGRSTGYMQTCLDLHKEEPIITPQSLANTEKSSTNRKSQLCVTCGKLVKNLWYHIGTHADVGASYACPHCPMKMKNQSNLARHIQAVHLKKVVKSCEPCGRGFSHINSYKAHMRSRHGVGETYQCQSCLKTFKQPSGYKKHMSQAHSNERNFVCSVCSKPFKDKQALNLHKNVHSTERPYVCGMCPKQFKGASAKRTHELTHVGVTFKCALCDKSYQYKSLLNLHVKKNHPDEI